MSAARIDPRDRRYAACLAGLGLLGLQVVLPPVIDAAVALIGVCLSAWCWPWKESPGSFGAVAGPALLLVLAAMIVLGPLARAGQPWAIVAMQGVAWVGPLLWACASAWIVWLWITRRPATS